MSTIDSAGAGGAIAKKDKNRKQTVVGRANELALRMMAVGKSHRKPGTVNELKTGLLLDNIRRMQDLASSIRKRSSGIRDNESRNATDRLLLRVYDQVASDTLKIPDITNEELEFGIPPAKLQGPPGPPVRVQAAPSNLSAPTIQSYGNSAPIKPSPTAPEIVLPA